MIKFSQASEWVEFNAHPTQYIGEFGGGSQASPQCALCTNLVHNAHLGLTWEKFGF